MKKKFYRVRLNYDGEVIEGVPYFKFKEVLYSDLAKHYIKPWNYQLSLLRRFFIETILPVREKIGRMKVTSGVRDKIVMSTLFNLGRYPSFTTDHAYLDPQVNSFGVGAIDFIPLDIDIKEAYEIIYDIYKNEKIPLGQLIIYQKRLNRSSFIHISYSKYRVFTGWFADKVIKSQSVRFLECKYGEDGKPHYYKVQIKNNKPIITI